MFLEVLEIAFLKMKKHYNKSIFTIMMIKKAQIFIIRKDKKMAIG